MKSTSRWQACCILAAGLGLASLAGCQTWVAGMTLPSGRYLEHPPQYFPPTPPFPLTKELAGMEGADTAPAAGVPGGAAPVVPNGGPGLAPGMPAPGAPGMGQ